LLFKAVLGKNIETKMILELFGLSEGEFELRKKIVRLLLTRKLSFKELRYVLFGVKEYQRELCDQIITKIISRPQVPFKFLYDIIYYFPKLKDKKEILIRILEVTDNERDLEKVESEISKWKESQWDNPPYEKEVKKKRNELKLKKFQQLEFEKKKGKIIPANEIIGLFLKHPDYNPSRPYAYYPDEEQKELLEFLLGDTLLCDAKGSGFIPEFEPAVAVCLAELQEQEHLRDLFTDILPVINKIQEKKAELIQTRNKNNWEKIRDEALKFKEQIIEKLAERHQDKTVRIFPFSPEQQLRLRKKILLNALKKNHNDSANRKLVEIVKKEAE